MFCNSTGTEDLPHSTNSETDNLKSHESKKDHMIVADAYERNTKTINPSVGVPLEIFPYRFPENEAKVETSTCRSVGIPEVISPRLSEAHLAYLLKLPHSSSIATNNHVHTSAASFSTGLSAHLTLPFQPYDKMLSRSMTSSTMQDSLFDHRKETEPAINYLSPNSSTGTMEALQVHQQPADFSSLGAYVLSRLSTNGSRPPHTIDVAPSVETKGYLPSLQVSQEYNVDSPFMISTSHRLIEENVHQRSFNSQQSSRRATRSKERQKLRMTNETLISGNAGSVEGSKDRDSTVTEVKRRRSMSFGHRECDEPELHREKLLSIYGSGKESSSVPAHIKDSEMYRIYNSWALKNYGDSGKTKTVTRNKYRRIVRILTGDDSSATDNAKFKFWVKAKGFCLSPVKATGGERILLVPSKHEVRCWAA